MIIIIVYDHDGRHLGGGSPPSTVYVLGASMGSQAVPVIIIVIMVIIQ